MHQRNMYGLQERRKYWEEKNKMAERIVQTAGREQLGEFAPMFAHLNDDCVKIGLNRKSLIESRFRGAVLFL